jgi:polyhydroxybutyrate depolymerase
MFQRVLLLSVLALSPVSALALSPGLALAASPATSATCSGKTGVAGSFDLTLQSGGYTRTYHLHVPSQYKSTEPMPLVINFHGWGSNGLEQDEYTGMSAKGDQAGFITIHPDGIDNSWNAGSCCGTAAAQQIDDVGFARDLVKSVSAAYCVDAARVYATGFSNGGYMSHRLACEASDVFAAVAPASGLIGIDDCKPPRPVPVIQSQGTVDPLVPYRNAKASNDYWVAYNKCSASSVVYRKGVATCTAHTACAADATVEWCEVKGMGHAWPTGNYLNDTDTFWDFFTKHPMGQ